MQRLPSCGTVPAVLQPACSTWKGLVLTMPVVEVERGRYWLAFGAADPAAKAAGKAWVESCWLFFLEPLGSDRCRFISRYRTATSDDLGMKLAYGAAIEPIGFAMDRRMLLGVKERVERHG